MMTSEEIHSECEPVVEQSMQDYYTMLENAHRPQTSSYVGWAVLILLSLWIGTNLYWDRETYIELKQEVKSLQYQIDETAVQPADVLEEVKKLNTRIEEAVNEIKAQSKVELEQ